MKQILVASMLIIHLAGFARGGDLGVRFLAESMPEHPGKVTLIVGEGESEPFDLPLNNLSAPQRPHARSFGVRTVDGKFTLSTIELPAEGNSFVVLLISGKDGGFSPVVIRDDDPTFRPGDIYFHNLTEKTVLGTVGTAAFLIAPVSGAFLTPKEAQSEGIYQVQMSVREPDGDRTLAAVRWPEDKQSRRYVFFFVDPQTQRIAYRGVDEYVEPGKPAP